MLPLMWGEYAREAVKRTVMELKRVDGVLDVKRRGEGSPKWRVGQLCLEREQNRLGVVVGWDKEFSDDSCGEWVSTEHGVRPNLTPFFDRVARRGRVDRRSQDFGVRQEAALLPRRASPLLASALNS